MSGEGMAYVSGGMGGESWQCTGEVRWIKRSAWMGPPADVAAWERWRDAAPGEAIVRPSKELPRVDNHPVLQQRWIRLDAPGEEWRDVPTVEG